MVKLSDDCFAHDGALMTVAEAFEQIETRLAPIVDSVAIDRAFGMRRQAHSRAHILREYPSDSGVHSHVLGLVHSDLFPDSETVLSVGGGRRRDSYSTDSSVAAKQCASLLARLCPRVSGNPMAAFVTFITIAKPLILKLAGAAPTSPKAIPGTCWFGPPQEAKDAASFCAPASNAAGAAWSR
jgi:hypothetical protein